MENQRLDFGEIVRKIAEDKMLLPDFQRGFVWKDEEQRKIVASVLAKMPIGSILLLKSKPDEYASKSIGMKEKNTYQSQDGEVEFLLDGQQRMTALTNVFSNVIFMCYFSLKSAISLDHRIIFQGSLGSIFFLFRAL